MAAEHRVNGHTFDLKAASDVKVAERVAAHMQRRIDEDDWRPFSCRDDAVRAWSRLGGIRVEVMRALGLL